LSLDGGKEMFGRFVVTTYVEAGDAKIVHRAGEGWTKIEGFAIGRDGFFRQTAVGESCAEPVPEEEVLIVKERSVRQGECGEEGARK
jgi:hypothetical protein